MSQIGYTNPLYILAFDHRNTFGDKLFHKKMHELSEEERDKISEFKDIIYEAFRDAVGKGVPSQDAAILVDEEFGSRVLENAGKDGTTTILTIEKTGQSVLVLEYGDEFGEHIEKYKPTFTKILIKYNPSDSDEVKKTQHDLLKKVADYSHEHGYKFLLEVLVPGTESQLAEVGGDKERYDRELRPKLTVEGMKEIQDAGVIVDVWKMEGLEAAEDYEKVVAQGRVQGEDVSVVVLGRGATEEKVGEWLKVGSGVDGVIGFAVGRTIFWDSLVGYNDGSKTREQAVEEISNKFQKLYNTFAGK